MNRPFAPAIAIAIFLFSWTCVELVVATPVTLNGNTYEFENGSWYLVDESDEYWQIAPNVIQIKFSTSTTEGERTAFAAAHDLEISPMILPLGYYRFKYPTIADPLDVLEDVLDSPNVADAELDTYLKFLGPPNDEYYDSTNMWNLFKIDLERAWEVTTGVSPVAIGIIDFGVDQYHEDLAATRWTNTDATSEEPWLGRDLSNDTWGWDFMEEDNDPMPLGPHGTGVTGMACAVTDNSQGIASIAGGRSGNRPIKWASLTAITNASIIDAIRYCNYKGIKVINMSFTGSGTGLSLIVEELDDYYAAGGLAFSASGNHGGTNMGFPARHPNVVAVGSTDDDDLLWDYSTHGSDLDLVAPSGEDIEFDNSDTPLFVWTTDNPQALGAPIGYNPNRCACPAGDELYVSDYFGGTSAASPQAAALAALVWSRNPTLTNAQVRTILERSARDLGDAGRDDEYGHGRLDAYRALTEWGTITTNTTWGASGSPSTIYVSGDLTIASGVTLTIAPGTTIKIADNDNLVQGVDDDKVEINVEGELIADGTLSAPIVFESWTANSSEDWVGFYFDEESDGALFDYCIIRHAEYGIESYVDLTVKNSDFEECRYAGIVGQDGTILIESVSFFV